MAAPGALYTPGVTPTIPNVYFHVEAPAGALPPSITNGVVAVIARADDGPLGSVVTLDASGDELTQFGLPSATSHTDLATLVWSGGGLQEKFTRLGQSGTGTAATHTFQDTTAVTPVNVLSITWPFVGVGGNSGAVTIQDHPTDNTKGQVVLWKGGARYLTVDFTAGAGGLGEPQSALNALAAAGWTTAALLNAGGNKILARVGTATPVALTTGANPTVNSTALSEALVLLEREAWNLLVVDTEDPSDFATILAFIRGQEQAGRRRIAFVGEPTSVAFNTRVADAEALNYWGTVYVGNGVKVLGGVTREGRYAAALYAGQAAAADIFRDTTFGVVPTATDVVGPLSDDDLVTAIGAGMVIFDRSFTNRVEVAEGVTSYDGSSDLTHSASWHKVYLTILFYRIEDALASSWRLNILGKFRNDDTGQRHAIADAQRVLRFYQALGVLTSFTVTLDPANPPSGNVCPLKTTIVAPDFIEILLTRLSFA